MQSITSSNEMLESVSKLRSKGLKIGFVPTMGALHSGHLSLIEASKRDNDITICSIFVNPTQFNDPNDFDKYPRQIEDDLNLLEQSGCDIVFNPSVTEVYPKADTEVYQLGQISEILEGTQRPGHFNGMASVVKRLLELTFPHKAYFGLKDYQQCLVVKALVKNYALPVTVVCCPIQRDVTGLAMSSRNQHLSQNGRKVASKIYACLQAMKEAKTKDISALIELGNSYLSDIKDIELEYLEVRDAETLATPAAKPSNEIVVLVAAWVEGVRLIDNMTMNFRQA